MNEELLRRVAQEFTQNAANARRLPTSTSTEPALNEREALTWLAAADRIMRLINA